MKTVTFAKPRTAAEANPIDQWVGDAAGREREERAAPQPQVRMKRFTIDVPEDLHKRIKSECASQGIKMADMLREILETRFPAKS